LDATIGKRSLFIQMYAPLMNNGLTCRIANDSCDDSRKEIGEGGDPPDAERPNPYTNSR